MNKTLKIALLINGIPIYRRGFYTKLMEMVDLEITIYCQDKIAGYNTHLIHSEFQNNVKLVNHYSQKKSLIVWQSLPFIKILNNYDIVFVEGNPRVISHALIATILLCFRKKVVLWSMVHSSNNHNILEWIRIQWIKLFKFHFVYNESDIPRILKLGLNSNRVIGAMNNGLDQEAINKEKQLWTNKRLLEWKKNNNLSETGFDLITLGRLQKGKYEILIEAMNKLNNEKLRNYNLCIIGDGDAMDSLKLKVEEYKLESNVFFAGALFDEEKIAPFMLSSKIFIHPTAVGLSIMHAFGYALPIITHDNKDFHGPEIVAFQENINGLSYKNGELESLAESITILLESEQKRKEFSVNALSLVENKYNTTFMAKNFRKMIDIVNINNK